MRSTDRIKRALRLSAEAAKSAITHPKEAIELVARGPSLERDRGRAYANRWSPADAMPAGIPDEGPNPMRDYFETNQTGPGIWKWRHYFEPYQRHLAKFVGQPVDLVEIGVYSGGSLPMWRDYLGPDCHIHGIDIEPACAAYVGDHVDIAIGDQGDRTFWADYRRKVPSVDIVIDDGCHLTEQQIVTLEEMLPHLRPGGVLIIEDVYNVTNPFAQYALGLVDYLNQWGEESTEDGHGAITSTSPFQRAVHSIHFYPFLMVIEKLVVSSDRFEAPKHGTEWQPFL